MAKKPTSPTEITSIRHKKDTRVNIPTEELRDFVAEDEKAPKAMLYPRDPSLDPQLVWKGKDQTIYFDPPYGIKFGSNWQVSTRKRDVKDGKVEDATRQPEQVRAFRDTWKLGVHSYLAYLRDRLTVARDLLTESGSIFVQIGDENVHRVRTVMDEVFGESNFISLIAFLKTSSSTTNELASTSDYIVWYARNKSGIKFRAPSIPKLLDGPGGGEYRSVILSNGTIRRLSDKEV